MPAKKAVKPAPKTVKKVAKPSQKSGQNGLSVTVLDITGKSAGTVKLSEVLFGAKVNKSLLSQAVRVFLANQRRGTADTKTRGEVRGSTRKIYRQKGTGRARHGGIRAPIFVKGGIAHGPKPKDYSLSMPVAMKRKALFSALSAKLQAGEMIVVAGFEKLEKTKAMAKSLTAVGMTEKDSVLFVMPEHKEDTYRAIRNVAKVYVLPANQLNTYEILMAKKLIVMKDAIEQMEKVFGGSK